jgi:hypothetical protein
LALLITAGRFYFRWQKQHNDSGQQQLLHQQQLAEAETVNAQKQLEEYTNHLLKKNDCLKIFNSSYNNKI